MCPACFEALALLIVGVGSSGGLAAVLASKLRREAKDAQESLASGKQEEEPCQTKPQ
jgi:hypothetical protein